MTVNGVYQQGYVNRIPKQPTARHGNSKGETANTSWLRREDARAIDKRCYCGNCKQEKGDLTYVNRLQWLLCRECRILYRKALAQLSAPSKVERSEDWGHFPQFAIGTNIAFTEQEV